MTEAPEPPQSPLAPAPADATGRPTPIDASPSPVPCADTVLASPDEAVAAHPTATAASPVSGDAGTASEAAARHSSTRAAANLEVCMNRLMQDEEEYFEAQRRVFKPHYDEVLLPTSRQLHMVRPASSPSFLPYPFPIIERSQLLELVV